MKKQVLFTLCLTVAAAAVLTGCARKGEIKASQQDATPIAAEDEVYEGSDEGVTVQPSEATPPPPPPAEDAKPAPGPGPQNKDAAPQDKGPAPDQPEIYTVTKGDSLSALSVRFGVRQPDILALNPELRKNPNNLKIGQKVKFPAGTDISKKAKPRDKGPAPSADATVYVVKSGDVLGGIANRYGVKVADIKKANNLKSDNILVGQKLTIPGAKKAPKDKGPKANKDKAAKDKGAKPQPKPESKPAPAPAAEEQQGEEALPPPPAEIEDDTPPALLPPPPAPGAEPADGTMETYTTKEGDDLTSVSLMWSVPLQELRAANGISDTAGNVLPAGTVLKIPLVK